MIISAVALAAIGGRVRTLLVDADRIVPGAVDPGHRARDARQLDDPHTDDVVDDLAELTLRMGGEVVVAPSDRMPSETGVAAIFRF